MSETAPPTALLRLAPDAGRDPAWLQPDVPQRYRIHNRTFYLDTDAAVGQVIRVAASVGFLVGQGQGWRYSVGASIKQAPPSGAVPAAFQSYDIAFADVADEAEALALAEEAALTYLRHPFFPEPPAPIPNLDLVDPARNNQTPMDFIRQRLPFFRDIAENIDDGDYELSEEERAALARVGDDVTYLVEQKEELLAWGTELAHELESAQAELVRLNAELAAGNASDGYHTHNELYEQRLLYHAHIAQRWYAEGVPVVKSKRHHTGEECLGGGWFIVMMYLATGQVSQHYPISAWNLFAVPAEETAWQWDGHDAAEGNRRLREALRLMPPSHNMPQRRCTNTAEHDAHYFADSRVFWCATTPPSLEVP
jgi:hypothetical protein